MDNQQLESELQGLKQQYDEIKWFYGEEISKRERLQAELDDLKARFAVISKELDDAKWFLGEERAKKQEMSFSTSN